MSKTSKHNIISGFNVGQHIFIKKYKGNYLVADTSKTYKIIYINNTIYDYQSSSYFKTCILDNGFEQPICTRNMGSKKKTFYIEPAYTFSYFCCCFV